MTKFLGASCKKMEKLHLVYSHSALGCLSYLFEEKEDDILALTDDISIGPLFKIDTEQGDKERKKYTNTLLKKVDLEFATHHTEIDNSINTLLNFPYEKYEKIFVWCGKNIGEQLLMAIACSYIPFQKIQKVDVSKQQLFINFSHASLACLSPEEIQNLLPTAKSITEQEYSFYKKYWKEILNSHSLVRIYDTEKGKITFHSESFYDEFIISCIPNDFQKAARIVGLVLGTCGQLISDTFIAYRLKVLAQKEKFKTRGNLSTMRSYEVKI